MWPLAYDSVTTQLTADWVELIDDYLTELAAAGRPATSIRLRRNQLNHMTRCLQMPPEEVSTRVLLGWFASQGRWARETRRSYRSAARSFFGWAHQQGHLPHDPAAGLPIVGQRAGVPHPVPDDVYAAALATAAPAVVLMMRLAAEAGLRRGEIAKIGSADLLPGAGGFSLLVHGKGDKDRLIPILNDLAAPIAAAHGWLFPNRRGGHLSPEWVGEACSVALPAGWTLHALRHLFATKAYAATHDLRAVQILLGHSSPTVTQRYVAIGDAELRAVMSAASNGKPDRCRRGM